MDRVLPSFWRIRDFLLFIMDEYQVAVWREGFQQLLAEISLGKVGIILSLEAARLARNCSDWYRLLELCSIFGTVIADYELVYDPRLYHDRLLLGLAGIWNKPIFYAEELKS